MNPCTVNPRRMPAHHGLFAALVLPLAAVAQTAPSVSTTAEEDEPLKLSVFTVTADQDKGYGSTHSIAGSRINVALKEVPNYTITLNEALLKDLGAIDMNDALPYASGVSPAGTGFADTQLSLRGYALAGSGLRDGLPDTESGTNVVPSDSTSFERIEISKGPAGVLYGANSMGGIVNRVSKMPQYNPFVQTQLSVSGGSQQYIRGMVDATGPIGESKRTAYRLATSYQDGERSWGGVDDKYTIYSVLKHNFGEGNRSAVWGRFMFYNFTVNPNQGVYFLGKGGTNPGFQDGDERDKSNFPEDREIAHTVTRSYELGYETSVESAGGAEWSLRILGRYGHSSGDKDPSWAGGTVVALDSNGALLGNTTTIAGNDPRVADWRTTLSVRAFEGFAERGLVNVDLAGKFKTGPANHTLILNTAGNYGQTQRTFNFWNAKFANAPASAANTYSLINYERDLAGVTYASVKANDTMKFNALNNNTAGLGWSFGAQDSVSFLDKKVIAVVGTRYDWNMGVARLLNSSLTKTSESTTKNQDWTHKYGLVVAPIEGVSLFAQESTTFTPINSINNATGQKFPNQQGKSHELGIKLEFFGGRLVGTASVFDMELTNVIIGVVNPPELGGGTVQVPAGTQNTEGWEMDLAYQPFPGLTLLVAYSDLESTNENGKGFRGAPQTATYSGFVKYSLMSGALRGVGGSIGYRHYGEKPVDAADTFRLAETDTVDLGLFYEPANKPWNLQLNVLNVTDDDSPFTSVSQNSVIFQFPITYRLTMNYRF